MTMSENVSFFALDNHKSARMHTTNPPLPSQSWGSLGGRGGILGTTATL